MSKNTLPTLVCLAVLALLGACESPDKKEVAPPAAEVELPCTCGQPEAVLEACVHPLCVSGQGNPDNPDCVCGPLSYEGSDE